MFTRILILLTLYGQYAVSQEADLYFRHLSREDGLPTESNIFSITQDAEGLMWLATDIGIVRYDGNDFKTYRHDPLRKASIKSDDVLCVYTDQRNQLWVGSAAGLDLYNPISDTFSHMTILGADNKPVNYNEPIKSIFQDENGRYYAYSYLHVYTVDFANKTLHPFLPKVKNGKVPTDVIRTFLATTKFAIWFTHNQGFYVYSFADKSILKLTEKDNRLFNGSNVAYFDKKNRLWLGTSSGLTRSEPISVFTKDTKFYPQTDAMRGLRNLPITNLKADKKGNIWVATDGAGIYKFISKTETYINYRNSENSPHSILNDKVHDIFIDSQNNLWTLNTPLGVSVASLDRDINFRSFQKQAFSTQNLSSNVVSAFAQDSQGNIWIGTDGGGLELFERASQTMTHFRADSRNNKALPSDAIMSLYVDFQDNLWVGTYEGGLSKYNSRSRTFTTFKYNPFDSASISSNSIVSIMETPKHELVALTLFSGISIKDPKTDTFTRIYADVNNPIALSQNTGTSLCSDSKGGIWVGTYYGLNYWNLQTNTFERYFHSSTDSNTICDDQITSIFEDRAGQIWVGTRYGLAKFDRKLKRFMRIAMSQEYPTNVVNSIIEDKKGDLWLGTLNGLARLNPKTYEVQFFNKNHGVHGLEMRKSACLMSREGELYFGGVGGFTLFRPENIRIAATMTPVRVNTLSVLDKPVNVGDTLNGRVLLAKDLMFVDKIILRHEENSFSFSFSAFEFISPAAVEYHYRLKDFETDWHKTNSLQRVATYTNLNAGLYTFQVKSSSVLSVRESKIVEITIQILPPWWKTWWAYVIYVTIFVGLLGLYLKIMRRQYILQQDFFVERVKHDKDIETSRMKLNFFTNITHEFRTPLTLILGPLEKLMDDFQHNQELRTELNVIQRNAQRLLDLINEILDFRKLEESSLQLKLGNHDIVRFVQLVALKFESHARLHNIAFHITHIPAPVMLMFDQTKLEKVLYNLFSNAFKFTPDGGRIECRISIDKNDLSEKGADMLLIEIEDNGSGIRKDEIGHIFERYFSGESRNTNFHTGIGLALSKEIIDLHKGVILARNNAANGACFTLKLPVSFQYITKEPIVDEIFVEKTNNLLNFEEPFLQNDAYYNTNTDADKKIILVVEDNDDIRNFVKHSFNDEYKVIEATNGEDALVVALEAIPDLIITDIMMPQMDGTVLCKTLKNDDRTSHIPIIIITALSELESRIQCIELGADSYIPKPFHLKHLQARVRQLIGLRVTLQQKYSENITKVHPNEIMTVAVEQIKSADEIFLERTALIIEKKLGDSEFNLNALCLELGMKHPQLYRKVKALTGMSIKDFILSIRMKNATQLLLTGNFNIAEVGYMVGFSSPAYFTETFKKHFGQTPSDYLKTGDPDCS